jgi:Ca-activated chloride channel family protein
MDPTISTKALSRMGELIVSHDNSPLPLEKSEYHGQILGPVANITVVQHFRNPLDQPAELMYLFPLSHSAAILDFELNVGERTIQAELMELEKAREEYERALRSGRRVGLLEERRKNLMAVQLGNVRPGESLKTRLQYQERLSFHDGAYELVIPMGITPRYHSPGHPEEGIGLDAPVAGLEEPIGGLEIDLTVDAGVPTGDPECATHPIEFSRLDDRRFDLHLTGSQIPDHDFVLRYPIVKEQPGLAAWRASGEDGDYFLLTLIPPAWREMTGPVAREYIFVLDRSGSMQGEPMKQAVNALKACLRTLDPTDRFRILLFNQITEWYQENPVPVTQEAIDNADRFLSGVVGAGGTEIVPALAEALSVPVDPDRDRLVVFLTDGAVSAEDRAYQEVDSLIGQARLFTIGIGPSVNRAFLEEVARLGRGRTEFIGLDEDIEGAIIRFQDRLSFPALTDIKLVGKQNAIWDLYPTPLRDLYYGETLEILGRMVVGNTTQKLVFTGRRTGEEVNMEAELPPTSQPEPVVERLWARARLDSLITQQAIGSRGINREAIINLALKHRLVTPYTAFVAVNDQAGLEGARPRQIIISQPLPPELSLEGFLGGGPAQVKRFMPQPDQILRTLAKPAQQVPEDRENRVMYSRWNIADEDLYGQAGQIPEPDWKEDTLRWLARNQRVNGSWKDDVETTTAALLAFVRAGHTTQEGDYRRQVSKAIQWLNANKGDGFAAFLRVLALRELSAATRQESHQQIAKEALQQLPPATNDLEKAALAILKGEKPAHRRPSRVFSIDDLRWAVLIPGPPISDRDKILSESRSELDRILAAAVS